MRLTLIYVLTFLFIQFTPSLAIAYQSSGIYEQNDDKTFIYSEQTDSFKRIPHTKEAVDSLLMVSADYVDKDSGISFQAARHAEIIAESIEYKEGKSHSYNLLGSKYLDFGDHETANTYYLKALRIEEELGNDRGIANLLNNLSLIYVEQEQYSIAAEYLEKSINTWQRLDEDHQSLISINNLGVIHRRQGNYKEALDYFWETAKRSIQPEEPDSLSYIIATLNIGNTYRNMGNYSRAKIHLDTALEFLNRHEITSHLVYTNIVMGRLYHDTGKPEKAIEITEKGLRLAESEQMLESIKEAHELLAIIYEGIEKFDYAYRHYQLFHKHSDSLRTMQSGTKISELQQQFNVEQKDREIEILSQEAKLREANLVKMNQMRSYLTAGVIILFIVTALLYSSNRTRKRNNQSLEKQRRQIEENNKKLSNLNAEKDEFLSIAAHDLRNPLSSINLAVDMIDSEETTDKNTIREYTDLIKISSNRMIALINDVLKIHTIGPQDLESSTNHVDINPLIDESLQHFNEPARSKSIRIRTVLNRSNDPVVGDSDNILRILDNLISNAIKYSPKHSSVIISTKQTGEKIQISVRDQGPGISDSDKEKLFKKFSKLQSKPTGNETSTGLGLYIVKKICDSMGGSVRCESEPGCGATFIVELPAAASESSSIDRSIKKKRVALG